MHLNPYGEYAVILAASLANDWPDSREGIVERTRKAGMTVDFPETPPAARPGGLSDHQRVRAVIDQWLGVVDASDEQERAAILNAQMARATAYPRLTDHDGEGWHLHYRDDGATSLLDVLAAVISVGTALHLTTRGAERLHRCAAGA